MSRLFETFVPRKTDKLYDNPVWIAYPVPHGFDLRNPVSRKGCINRMMILAESMKFRCKEESLLEIGCMIPQHVGDADLMANCLSLEFIIRQQSMCCILMCIAQCPTSDWHSAHIGQISYILMSNRSIGRHVFKSKQCCLWKPLLSAQIAVLVNKLKSGFELHFSKSLLVSMKYWNKEQMAFAVGKGLFEVIGGKVREKAESTMMGRQFPESQWSLISIPMGIDHLTVLLLFGLYLCRKLKFDPNRVCPWKWCGDELGICTQQSLQSMKAVEMICCWPQCKTRDTKQADFFDKKTRKMYRCERCLLVKYCCRNHQKKHWKFIHRQQCQEF